MRQSDQRTSITLRLYLRLCVILVPCFLLVSAVGLFFSTEFIVADARDALKARITKLSETVASSFGRMSDEGWSRGSGQDVAFEELASVLLADAAVLCVSVKVPATNGARFQARSGMNCSATSMGPIIEIPLAGAGASDLIVHWTDDEVFAVRTSQLQVSALVVVAGLMIALIANWLTFRFIIGRPFSDMVREIDDARHQAEVTALHDNMTGLANRRYLNDVVEECLQGLRDGSEGFAILQLDLDHFQDINDSLGHAAGDAMLRHVAHVLRKAVRPEDFVARVGGDEFVILVHRESNRQNLATLAERVIQKVSTPLVYQGHNCAVATSIGVYPIDLESITEETTVDHILMNAEFALRHCKALGRGRHLFFEEGMRAEVEAAKFLANDFERGFNDAEIVCYYQPQFDVSAGKVLSVEALVRWKHPLLGLLNPHEFLPLADKLELTAAVDEKILKMAMTDLASWDKSGLGIESVSVNISAGRLEDPKLLESLRSLEIPRGRLTFEILETAFVDDLSDVVRWNLDGMRELGIEIELDDFGTGKASVLGVIEMAPHRIKVARELIASLGNGEQGISFVRAIAAIGHSLDVGMVAEGVEEAEHCRIAAELGFQRLQGYHISRPLPRDALELWITQNDFRLSA